MGLSHLDGDQTEPRLACGQFTEKAWIQESRVLVSNVFPLPPTLP